MEVPVAGAGTPAVDIGELLRWNGVGEPFLLRELTGWAGALRILDDYGVEELSPRDYGSWRPSKQSVSRLPSTPIHLNEPVSGSPQLMMLA